MMGALRKVWRDEHASRLTPHRAARTPAGRLGRVSVSELSASTQNYLKAVWSLQEWSDAPVTATTIAEKAGVKLSTASDAVRKLSEQGLLDHAPYGAIALTERGRDYAIEMVRRHRLIETFLVETLGYTWDQVHDEAETLEHAVSDFMIAQIDGHLGHPTRDPHGDPIPSAGGDVHRPDAVRLSSVPAGHRVRAERVSDADPELLQYFASHGIAVGTVLTTRAGAPYSESVEVEVEGGSTFPLGRGATDAVWVTSI